MMLTALYGLFTRIPQRRQLGMFDEMGLPAEGMGRVAGVQNEGVQLVIALLLRLLKL